MHIVALLLDVRYKYRLTAFALTNLKSRKSRFERADIARKHAFRAGCVR